MSPFLSQAEQILETAEIGSQEVAIVVDRQGGLRMLDPSGWSLPAMRVEFAAAAVYKVERRGGTIRVDGWDGARSCRLEKCIAGQTRTRFASPLLRHAPERQALPAPA